LIVLFVLDRTSDRARAARELQRTGWKKARALIGGWEAWQTAGLPIEKNPV
jgi:3-mercaptopyruvate sulfurtransferase SseA